MEVTANNIVSCVDMVHRRESDVSEDEYFSSVPYVLQMLAAEPDGVEALKSFACVGVGGSALSRHIGDDLVHQGVKLVSRYGSAECGFLMSSHRVYDEDSEWEYLRANSQNDGLIFEANDDNRYELIVSPSWPHLSKSNRPDGSFATSDLFVPHPTIPNAWRYDSRADSQLTLITGKKFDPAPLEADIAASPLLDDVVIFGNERPFPGALIFRSASAKAMLNTELVQAVTPEVERLNVRNQDHARIPRNMLCPIAFEDNRLKKTSKMTVIRREAYKDYDDVIKRAYKHLEKATDEHVSDRDLAKVIQSTVQTVTGRSIGLDDDLTSFGVDSIGSIQIRYALKRLLPPGSKELPFTVVEDRGTISRLAKFLIQFRQGKTSEYNDEQLLMRDLVDEYSSFAIPETSTKHYEANTPLKDSGEVVVLTGVTGALGAHIFHQLRNVLSISKIYCLVRGADNHAARSRVVKSLGSRKLPTLPEEHYASNSEHATPQIIVLPCKLHEPGLGLSDRDYNVLCSTAIVIIHAAWTVNFRLGLRSFARDQIPGLKHMLDLALGGWTYNPKGMPKFAFVSSTASVANSSGQSTSVDAGTDNARTRRFISETISRSPNTSSPLGYSRSKWVAESLCARAATAAATAVNTTGQAKDRIFILRVGQLSADIQNGIWNASEAYPLMLGSVRATGCLPDLGASEIKGENESALNWLPVDTAATAIVQALLPASSSTSDAQQLQPAPPEHGEDHARVLHITHPAPQLRWSLILQCLRDDAGERFDLLPPSQWVRELEKLEEGSHPALALLPLWKESYDSATEREGDSATKDKSGTGEPVYDTRRARESAPVLRQLFEARGNGANDDADVQSEYVGKMWRWIKENVGGATSGS
ncbi:MAG: hypothetical protein M1831_007213 [Alyxoria varia]|nr:MAG: hypothetical protein M1831_007213 [Alyxoria varia]